MDRPLELTAAIMEFAGTNRGGGVVEEGIMWEAINDIIQPWAEAFELGVVEMAVRSAVVYAFAIVVVRIGNKRFMGRNTAFDLLLGIMLGSVLSRAITGQAPFLPALVAGGVLVAMHWTVAALAIHWQLVGPLIKGRPRKLIEDGEVDWKAMRRSHLGEHDLDEALRANGRTTDVKEVEVAYLERNGGISILTKERKPHIVEVRVEEGVEVLRIELRG